MSALERLHIVDLRGQLPHDEWIIGLRKRTDSITWHWNGPAVAEHRMHGDGLVDQLIDDAIWQMRPGWGGTKEGAPHLMYHLAIGSDGQIYLCCKLDEKLWHCGHQDGNGTGLSIHLAVGKHADGREQRLTPRQADSLLDLTEALRLDYQISRSRIVGHREWTGLTECPGNEIMELLQTYRAGKTPLIFQPELPAGVRAFQIRPELTANARVRQDYRLNAKIAGTLKPGSLIYVDSIHTGDRYNGNPRWVHMARIKDQQADLGFINMELVREVKP